MAHVHSLATGVDYADLNFLGTPGIIATGLIHGPDGVAIVDPGPSTTLDTLEAILAARGFAWRDVTALLITHIHLDHAGATGSLLKRAPQATVYVHERGAPHLIDPSKLLESATRLYREDMGRLWGEVLAVPADRVHALGASAGLTINGHDIEVKWTPGHAWHHVSYFLRSAGVAFVGDTAGISRGSGRLVIPPTPPPDINLEAWRESTQAILDWNPETLFLTHFGPHPSPRLHFQTLWRAIDDWSAKVKASLTRTQVDDEARATQFVDDVTAEISRTTSRAEADSYAKAGRFDYSWIGLARYWRKREQQDLTGDPETRRR